MGLLSSVMACMFVVVTITPSGDTNALPTKESRPKLSFSKLPLNEEDKVIIDTIITTMAQKNVLQLGLSKRNLERNGKKINHIHPLRFIGYIIQDPELKSSLKEIKKSGFKWHGFLRGFERRLKEEMQRGNLLVYIPEFSKDLHMNEKQVKEFVVQENWEELLNFLIDHI